MQWQTFLTEIVEKLILVFAMLLIAYLTYRWNIKSAKKISDRKKRREIYSRLTGLKRSLINYRTHQAILLIISKGLSGFAKRIYPINEDEAKIYLEESKQFNLKFHDGLSNLLDVESRVFETVALIETVFPNVEELTPLVERIYQIKVPKVEDKLSNEIKTYQELQEWIKSESEKTTLDTIQEIEKLFAVLLQKLKEHIDNSN